MWDDLRRAQRRFADKYWFQIATVIWFFMLIIYIPPPWSMRVTIGDFSGFTTCSCTKNGALGYTKQYTFAHFGETYTANNWNCPCGKPGDKNYEGERKYILYDANNPNNAITAISILVLFAAYGILLLIGWVGRWILRKFYGIPPEEERENNMRSWVFRNLVSGSTRVPKK